MVLWLAGPVVGWHEVGWHVVGWHCRLCRGGWHEDRNRAPFKDHAAVGMDFENRFRTFRANMDTIRRLMAGETVGAASTGAMKRTGDTA